MITTSANSAAEMQDYKIIDSHFHLWELARDDYGWITPALEPLYRDYGPEDLRRALRGSATRQLVLVQCAPSAAETEYLLGLAQAMPEVGGVVGWVDFSAADAPDKIRQMAQRRKLLGLRPMMQDIKDPDWMLQPQQAAAFEAMIEHNLTFDALLLTAQLPQLNTLCLRYPELRVVIDHAAKPDIASGQLSPWRDHMAALAEQRQLYCKFSGMVTEASEHCSDDELRPYADELLKLFGEDRLLWGSDWPVVNLATDYQHWQDMALRLTANWGVAAQRKIFADNAEQFYGLVQGA